MSLKEMLDAGLKALPECRTIAYVDMPSGLVLGSASRVPVRQEKLDRLAVAAAALLDSRALAGIAGAVPGEDRPVTLAAREEAVVFVRAPSFPDHALCYSCLAHMLGDDLDRRIALHRTQVAAAL